MLGLALGILLNRYVRSQRLLIMLGAFVLLAGFSFLWWDYHQVKEFGWFAYEPLSKSEFFPPASAASNFGKAATALGLLALGISAGMSWGNRRKTAPVIS